MCIDTVGIASGRVINAILLFPSNVLGFQPTPALHEPRASAPHCRWLVGSNDPGATGMQVPEQGSVLRDLEHALHIHLSPRAPH